MEWNELRAFIAVADNGSFSRAAEQLHLTQPAISKRIQALEASVGVTLFDRVGKRVYLTEAGALLKPRALDLLSGLADTEVMLRNLTVASTVASPGNEPSRRTASTRTGAEGVLTALHRCRTRHRVRRL